ncbi:ATP-binding protein [Herminiimonas fonticola]|uniref:Putative exonuclease SbcCD C subunit n=1 Tax=Herminiimonas fonticola TaxID=303380 RepID=A0A4R6GJZ8_9BURK|nr:ATP-binding protein [Herminiimonas fonticola]RBA25672.1 P-loop containing region of AAA domain [Herminiimonas fonticola]TDN94780.1 putative exonuclease SbcCD C subunit [Herminiimonas fonticola]
MKLKKLILVNWGHLRSGEYPFGNMTLLTGPTGSGKSTILDAVQTVMTAVYQGIFSYNPGQEESSQGSRNGKSKRTIWSYVTGLEDNLFARPDGAHGYVVAVFAPDEGDKAEPFTAIIGAAAKIEGTGSKRQPVQERLSLVLVDGSECSFEDFAIQSERGMEVVPVEDIFRKLDIKYKEVINHRDNKREYLCQLYGRFRGMRAVSFPEASAAAKAWSQSIAVRPIGSVDELVKTQILEHDAEAQASQITEISRMMRNIHDLRKVGERLKNNIAKLGVIAEKLDGSTRAAEEIRMLSLYKARNSLQIDESAERDAELAVETAQEALETEVHKGELLVTAQANTAQAQVDLRARMQGVPALVQKTNIVQRADQAKIDSRTALNSLITGVVAAEKLIAVSRQVMATEFPHEVRALDDVASRISAAYGGCAGLSGGVNSELLRQLQQADSMDYGALRSSARLLQGADAQFGKLHAAFADGGGFVGVLHSQHALVNNAKQNAAIEEAKLTNRKKQLAGGLSDAPPRVYVSLTALQDGLPEAQAQLLCDLVEPQAGEWQRVIEGFMEDARFHVVVTPDFELSALEYCRTHRLPLKIIQGAMCLERTAAISLHPDSIVHELKSEHPVAHAYLHEQFGPVLKVAEEQQLKRTARGLTLQGSASSERKIFVINDLAGVKLVFGKEAKRVALERAKEEYQVVIEFIRKKDELLKTLEELLAIATSVTLPSFEQAETLERAAIALETCEVELSRLDLTELDGYADADKKLTEEFTELQLKISGSATHVGELRQVLKQHATQITQLKQYREKKIAEVDAERSRLSNFCLANQALSMRVMEEQIGTWIENHEWDYATLNIRINELSAESALAIADVYGLLVEYNTGAAADERLEATLRVPRVAAELEDYAQNLTLRSKVQEQLAAQKGIGIVKNLKEVTDSEQTFTNVFTGQFCMSVRESVDNGIKSLKALNNELAQLKFGTDKFAIDWSEWIPEYKEYYDFFVAAAQMSANEGGSLFADDTLSESHIKVRDRLRDILLQTDIESSKKEVLRIADYRNYRRYEIWKHSDIGSKIALSEWGTGSGGQLETPAYIIRAAVVTNRLKHFEKGMNLKFIVNDESFSKMDERRSLDVLKFLRDGLGMQFICAMPSRGAGPLKPEFTREWNFSRVESTGGGEVHYITEADERELRPDRLQELWEAHRKMKRTQAQIAFEESEAQ